MEVKPVKYTDGNIAQVGDRIRIDNGEREGWVEDIVDSPEKIETWGRCVERGILVKNDYYGRVFFEEKNFRLDEIILISRRDS